MAEGRHRRITIPDRVWLRTAAFFTGALLIASSALIGIDLAVIASRVDAVRVDLPASATDGQTWLLLGSDSRGDLPPDGHAYGSTARIPGRRADVIMLLHVVDGRATLVSVPRDLLLRTPRGGVERATLMLLDGPQAVVDGLCRTLGVAATHVAIVSMGGFAKVVDELGGVRVRLPAPVRDRRAQLDLPRAGSVQLTGVQALALVRSRHPQYLRDGRWVSIAPAQGAVIRQRESAAVFTALRAAAGGLLRDPLRAQGVAWAASGAVTVDDGTDLGDLLDLAGTGISRTVVLPARAVPHAIALLTDDHTRSVLRSAGYDGGCEPNG